MSPTSTNAATRAYLIFTGTGPILVLSTYPSLTDERLIGKLRYKGIDKFIAYEVDLEAVKARYAHSYANIVRTSRPRKTCACSTSTATRSWPTSRSTSSANRSSSAVSGSGRPAGRRSARPRTIAGRNPGPRTAGR